MNENTKATQTWGSVDWVRLAPANKRWNCISIANIALMTYRFLVAAGIIITIIIITNIDHKQLRIFNAMSQREGTRSINESEAHSVTGFFNNSHSRNERVLIVVDNSDDTTPDGRTRVDLRKEYVVYNPSCTIPNYPEFHRDVKPFVKKEKVNCTSKPELTTVSRLAGNGSYVLNVHKKHLIHYNVTRDLVCCYSLIYTDNDNYTIDSCVILHANVKLNSSADLVRVVCSINGTTIYKNVHFLIPATPGVHQKIKHTDDMNSTDDQPLSVMIVGLGAVSRLNLLRTMPETVKYVERNGWYGFKGYHKIDKNAFYNLNGPFLTGHSVKQLKRACGSLQEGVPLNNSCPWIWKKFSEKNYITAYGEDGRVPNGTFTKQPTDFFLRPHISVAYDVLAEKCNEMYPLCLGQKRAADYILDYSADFASRFVKYPTFSLFWVNSVGNKNMNYPASLDVKFVSYLDTLASFGVLNKSMVVFMSDHGFQKGNFRQTHMGFVEDSLPFLYIWLPKWYRERYPNKAENLARNTHMLTSHFDLYLTLMDVLGANAKAVGCPSCVSLFDPVPWNRGCADAGIAEDCCTCWRYEEISTDLTVAKQMALLVAADMNRLATEYSDHLQKGFKCATHSVIRIKSARRQIVKTPNSDSQLFVIQVVTAPGNVTVEAVIQLHTLEVLSVLPYDNQPYKFRESQTSFTKSHEENPWCVGEQT